MDWYRKAQGFGYSFEDESEDPMMDSALDPPKPPKPKAKAQSVIGSFCSWEWKAGVEAGGRPNRGKVIGVNSDAYMTSKHFYIVLDENGNEFNVYPQEVFGPFTVGSQGGATDSPVPVTEEMLDNVSLGDLYEWQWAPGVEVGGRTSHGTIEGFEGQPDIGEAYYFEVENEDSYSFRVYLSEMTDLEIVSILPPYWSGS